MPVNVMTDTKTSTHPIYPIEQKVAAPSLRLIPAPLTDLVLREEAATPIDPRYRTMLSQAFPFARRHPVTATISESDADAIILYDNANNVTLSAPIADKPETHVEWSDMFTLSILPDEQGVSHHVQDAIDSFVHGYNRQPAAAIKPYKSPLLTPGYFTKIAGKPVVSKAA